MQPYMTLENNKKFLQKWLKCRDGIYKKCGNKLSHSKTKSGRGPHVQGCCTMSPHLAGGRRKHSHTIIKPSLISLSIL